METSKQRYDKKSLLRVSTALHREKNAREVEKMEELVREGKSRGEYIRQAIIEKVAREDSEKSKK